MATMLRVLIVFVTIVVMVVIVIIIIIITIVIIIIITISIAIINNKIIIAMIVFAVMVALHGPSAYLSKRARQLTIL